MANILYIFGVNIRSLGPVYVADKILNTPFPHPPPSRDLRSLFSIRCPLAEAMDSWLALK